jgi:tetratricopeptide (TPR) repeat protein
VALAPLTLPGSARADVGDVAASSAVRLFVARATESQPGFALTPENASAVAEICRRLDGIPLAIELAAARLRLLTPAALVDRLENRLDLPGAQVDLPERQRTLRATVDWSYRLLGERERALLGRLSVFAGGWTVETAEALGADGDVLATLSSLVDSSLVTVDDTASAGPRFRMLGVVRDYAAERLAAGGDRDAAWTRLLDVVADFVERADAGLRTSYRAWAARIDDELDNIRAAWGRATEAGDAPTAFRIAAPLAYYYWSRNLLVEGLPLLERLSALPSVDQLDAPARGRLCWARGTAKIVVGQAAAARPLLEEALRVGRELEDAELVSRAMTSLSYLVEGDEIVPVRTALEEGAAHFRRSGDRVNEAYGLQALGQLVMRSGDLDAAAAVFDRCRVIAEEMDNDHLQAVALHQSGFTALLQGEPERARGLFEASVAANAHLLDQEGLAVCLDGFAAVAGAERRFVEAARLHSAAARLRAGLGISLWRVLQPIHDEGTAAARAALGDPRFEQERRAGAAMGASEALAYAREAVAGHTVAPRGAADGIDDPRVSRP